MSIARAIEEGLHDIPIDEPRPDPFRWYSDMERVTRSPQIIKGLMPAQSVVSFFGESGSGKTFLVTDIALHVAASVRWRDMKVTGGLVVYVAAEAAGSLTERVAAWRRLNPLVKSAPFAVLPGAVNLLERKTVDRLIDDIQMAAKSCGHEPALVIFDTLARCIAGADENSASDIGEAIGACDRIRTMTGATVLLVHHAGKDVSKGARGSSALRAAVDVEILIEGLQGTRTATVTKSRDGEVGLKMPFDLEPVDLGTDEDGDPITSCIVRPATSVPISPKAQGKQQQKLLAELERLQDESDERLHWSIAELRQIGRDLGMRKESARDAVTGLLHIGLLLPQVGGSYLASYQPEPGRKGRSGANHPESPRAQRGEKGEGSIRPRLSPRPSPPESSIEERP